MKPNPEVINDLKGRVIYADRVLNHPMESMEAWDTLKQISELIVNYGDQFTYKVEIGSEDRTSLVKILGVHGEEVFKFEVMRGDHYRIITEFVIFDTALIPPNFQSIMSDLKIIYERGFGV